MHPWYPASSSSGICRALALLLWLAVWSTSGIADFPGVADLDVQGHCGARGLLPENSMAAFERALELGVTTLEFDLQVTQDRVLVLSHDQTLNPKLCEYDDGRKVERDVFKELRFEDLAEIDCGRQTSSRFPAQEPVEGSRILRLEQVLELARDADYPVRISVEIKMQKVSSGVPVEEFAGLLVDRIREYEFGERTIVQSFSVAALQAVRVLEPQLALSALVRRRSDYDRNLEESGATILSPRHDRLRESDVQRFQERGIRVIPWTVNEPAAIRRMLEWGVDGVISDFPDRVLEIRREMVAGEESSVR